MLDPYKNIYGDYMAKEGVGFCYNIIHPGAISTTLLKKHQCLAKGCPFFKKNLEGNKAQYWEERERKKQRKKAAKKALYDYVERNYNPDRRILDAAWNEIEKEFDNLKKEIKRLTKKKIVSDDHN